MPQQSIQIQSGSLLLEGLLFTAQETPGESLVVVCHPHPQSGGEMSNNVVMAIVAAAMEAGVAAITFNFRGVGASAGEYDNGRGEQDDVRAALAYAGGLDGVERVGLAGYSFGAGMAAATVDEAVAALVLVAAPSGRLGSESKLSDYAGPALLVSGDRDHVSAIEAIEKAASTMSNGETISVPGVDHFWSGSEDKLRDIIAPFFARHLLPPAR